MSRLQPKFYPLTYVKATDVVNNCTECLRPLAGDLGSGQLQQRRSDQTSSFCCRSRAVHRVRPVDRPARREIRRGYATDIINLKHADAKEVATILTQMVAGQNASARNGGQEVSLTGATVAASAATGAAASPSPAANGKPERTAQFSNLVRHSAEERGNSLIVSGTDK